MPYPMRRILDGRLATPIETVLPDRSSVYRLYNQSGDLLYVGVAEAVGCRLSEHRAHRPWWSEVAFITTEGFAERAQALKAEAEAILDEGPLYNLAGIVDSVWYRHFKERGRRTRSSA